jgi:hypothetical protein
MTTFFCRKILTNTISSVDLDAVGGSRNGTLGSKTTKAQDFVGMGFPRAA